MSCRVCPQPAVPVSPKLCIKDLGMAPRLELYKPPHSSAAGDSPNEHRL